MSHLLLFLHISAMFMAVTVSFGSGLLMRFAYRTGQIAVLRGVAIASRPIGLLIPVLYLLGALFGVLTALSFGFDLLAPWLLIAYALFAVALLTGFVVNRPFGIRLGAILADTPDGPLSPSVTALFSEPRVIAFAILDYVVLSGLIFDMVVKPFS